MSLLRVFNRQKSRGFNLVLLRRIAKHLLEETFACKDYELGVHLIEAGEMADLNQKFLGHAGSTDVITFDHQEIRDEKILRGEIFISVDDALEQAREFKTTWQSEMVRYLTHGILHLEGYEDLKPAPRKVMKREENKLVKELSRLFDFGKLSRVKNVPGNR